MHALTLYEFDADWLAHPREKRINLALGTPVDTPKPYLMEIKPISKDVFEGAPYHEDQLICCTDHGSVK